MEESCILKVPEAALRGLASRASPMSSRLLVNLRKHVERQESFAPNFEQTGYIIARNAQGQGFDRPDVGCNVIAPHAVAPGNARFEHAVFVRHAQGHAVEFKFADVLHFSTDNLTNALVELAYFFFRIGIPQRHHREAVINRRELLGDGPSYPLRGRIGPPVGWILLFQRSQFFQQLIELKIGNLRCAVLVVLVVIVIDPFN